MACGKIKETTSKEQLVLIALLKSRQGNRNIWHAIFHYWRKFSAVIFFLLGAFIAELLSLLLVPAAVLFVWRSFQNTGGPFDLFISLLCFTVAFAGRFPVCWALSSGRKEPRPKPLESSRRKLILLKDGTEVYLEEDGMTEGPALVFLHGWSSNRLQWFYQRVHLGRFYRLVFIDLPGSGRSGKQRSNNYSLPRLAAELDEVLQQLEAEKIFICGHSIGG